MQYPQKYRGYPVTLTTALSPDECRQKLADQFKGRRSELRLGKARTLLIGKAEGPDFIIYPDGISNQVSLVRGDDQLRRRRFRLSFRKVGQQTIIRGLYGYEQGDYVTLSDTKRMMFGFSIGFVVVLISLIGLIVQLARADWLGIGVACIALTIGGTSVYVTLHALFLIGDADFRKERDYVARYIERILEAHPVADNERRSATYAERREV